jgi:hypothetical protein
MDPPPSCATAPQMFAYADAHYNAELDRNRAAAVARSAETQAIVELIRQRLGAAGVASLRSAFLAAKQGAAAAAAAAATTPVSVVRLPGNVHQYAVVYRGSHIPARPGLGSDLARFTPLLISKPHHSQRFKRYGVEVAMQVCGLPLDDDAPDAPVRYTEVTLAYCKDDEIWLPCKRIHADRAGAAFCVHAIVRASQ